MKKFVQWVLVVVGLFSATPAFAEPGARGDPAICEEPRMPYRGTSIRQRGNDIYERYVYNAWCEAVKADELGFAVNLDPKFGEMVRAWKTKLWDLPEGLPAWRAYRYTLWFANDSAQVITAGFSGAKFESSPMVEMLGSFQLEIPPCNTVTLSYVSPFPPELRGLQLYVGHVDEIREAGELPVRKGFRTISSVGGGTPMPFGYGLYYLTPKAVVYEDMSKVEAKAAVCKK